MAIAKIDRALENVLFSDKKKLLDIMSGENQFKGIFRQIPGSYIKNIFGADSVLGGGANGLLRVPHSDYYLEIYYNNELLTSTTFPYNPTSYIVSRIENNQLTHTTNRIFRETAINRVRNIAFEGFSGYATRLGYARDGGYIYENGEVIMHEFEEFLNAYNYLCSFFSGNKYSYSLHTMKQLKSAAKKGQGYGNLGNALIPYGVSSQGAERIFMVLRCVNEDIAYKVEVDNFTMSKDARGNKFGYKYNISFKSYGLYGPGRRSNPLLDFINKITGYINKANTILALLQALSVNTAEDYILPLTKPMTALSNVLDNLKRTIESVGIVTGAVAEVANTAVNLFEKIKNEILTGNIITEPIGNLGSNIKSQFKTVADNANNDFKTKNNKREKAQNNEVQIETADFALGLDTQKNSAVIDKKNIDVVLGMLKTVDYDIKNDDKNIELALFQSMLNNLNYEMENIKSIIPRNFVSTQKSIDKNLDFAGDFDITALNDSSDLYKIYRLKENEDLRDVARRLTGNAENYQGLVTLNGWMDSRRKGDGSLAVAGDKIKVIADEIDLLFSDDKYHVDLFSPFDDIIFTNNDLKLIGQIGNLQQSIKSNFLTYQEEVSSTIENYGLANLIGARNLDVVKQEIINKLLADPRVKNVNVKDIAVEGDKLLLSLIVTGIDNQIIEISAPTINNY
jgi:hypothetical protein